MTSFAPGTPPEVIAAVEKQFAERFKNAGIPMPPAPDIKNPFYDSPVRPDMPRQTLSPRQLRDQALASAKEARDKALQASRAIEAGGQRLAAKKSALGDYNKARDAAQQQYQYMKTLPKKTTIIGGDVIKPGRDYIPPPREQIDARRNPNYVNQSTEPYDPGYLKKGGKVKKYAAGGLMKPIAPDIKSPLRDAPSGLVSTQTTMKPRQYMKHQIQGAKQVREQQLDAARKMQDRAQRQQFKQIAQKDFENARNAAQQQYRATKLGPRTGGPSIDVRPSPPPGLRPPYQGPLPDVRPGKPTPIRPTPELIDDRPPKPGIKPRPIDPSMSGKPGMPTHITENGIKTADITPGTRRNMLQPPKPTLDTTMSDDFIKPRKNNQTGFLDRVKQSGMMKKGGSVKKYAAGGSVKSSSPMKSSASKRADGCAIKGKTRGRIV